MTRAELDIILGRHQKWINGEPGGKRAYLHGANLSGLDLSGLDLSRAYLSYADLTKTNLYNTNLHGTRLFRSNLTDADISHADLREAHLSEANLSGANLSGANLYGTCLVRANLSGTIGIPPIVCPEEGSFIGFKKALTDVDGRQTECIVKLRITEDAKRSSAATRKCRCDRAEVLSITAIDADTKEYKSAYAYRDYNFRYTVGGTVNVPDFDDNRWHECAHGIHFFMTREEAVDYEFN